MINIYIYLNQTRTLTPTPTSTGGGGAYSGKMICDADGDDEGQRVDISQTRSSFQSAPSPLIPSHGGVNYFRIDVDEGLGTPSIH